MAAASRRPLVVVPARFSASASALRHRADVTARALAEAVFAAGGEPVTLHPSAPGARVDVEAVRERIAFADVVLLPGGGDVAARWSGAPEHPTLYDVDEEQDAFDLALARVALADRIPLLSICRGTQIVNAVLGGSLVPDLAETVGSHRHRVHELDPVEGSLLRTVVGARISVSCYHHQCIDRLAEPLRVSATAADGVIEAVELDGWADYLGVQWHPEDTAATDPAQAALFDWLVTRAEVRSGELRA